MVTVFLVAVLIPCLFLAYLGIRSIQQEERGQQELVLQNLRTFLSTAIERTEESVDRHLRATFDTLYARTLLPATIHPPSLHAFPQTSSLADQVFVFDGSLHLLYPRAFRDPSRRDRLPGIAFSSAILEQLDRGEQQEAHGAFQPAADLFSQALRKSSATSERLRLLVRLARCQAKMHDLPGARHTYLQAIAEDRNRFLGEELPYSLVAYEQLAAIEENMLQPDSAAAVFSRLYTSLIQRFDRFEQAQFEYHASWVQAELERLGARARTGPGDKIGASGQMVEQVRLEAARAIVLRSALLSVVDSLLRGRTTSSDLQYRRTMIGGTTGYVGFRVDADARAQVRVVGLVFRPAALTSLCATLLQNTTVGPDLHLVLDRGQSVPLQAGRAGTTTRVVAAPFVRLADLMTGDKVAIVAINTDPVREIASRSMLLYYALIATMIGILILGAFLLLRDLSREQELSRMKTEFISNLTHEIKTPIAAIRSLAGNVTQGWVTGAKKQRDYFHMIERESERLGHLVENTLDFSRVESGRKRYRMEVVPAQQLLDRVVERFLALTDGQHVILSPSFDADLPKITVDSQAMSQTILNLLDNAVKYSPGRKLVELIARAEQGHLVITVKDYGTGIEKSELVNIFEKFYRVEQPAGATVPGSGIGLTLVKEIVEAHGGRVDVESTPQRGSAFSLCIPITGEDTTCP